MGVVVYFEPNKKEPKMSILSNQYRNKPWVRPLVLMAVGAALGAGGYAYLSPLLLPILHEGLCDGKPGCSYNMPQVPEIPQPTPKPHIPVCVKTPDGIEICK